MPTAEELQALVNTLQARVDALTLSQSQNHPAPQPNMVNVIPPPPYEPGSSWSGWFDQFEIYGQARSLTNDNEKKVALLQTLGNKAFLELTAWCAPGKPIDKSWTDLIALLKNHYIHEKNPMLARIQFSKTRQNVDESVSDFIRRMTTLATPCKFTEEISVIQEIIKGLRSNELRLHLLRVENQKTSMTEFKKVVDSFLTYQATVEETQVPLTVNQARPISPCPSCGKPHPRATCRFLKAECNNCHKVGHIASVCRSKSNNNNSRRHSRNRSATRRRSHNPTRRANQIEHPDDSPPSEEPDPYAYPDALMALNTSEARVAPMFVHLSVNGIPLSMQHDSGACSTIITCSAWKKIGSPPLLPEDAPVRGYQGRPVVLLGRCQVTVKYRDQIASLWTLVTQEDGDLLLGRPWIEAFDIQYSRSHTIHSISTTNELHHLLKEYQDIFDEKIGKCDIVAGLELKPDARPKFIKARPLPYSLRDPVRARLKELVEAEVLTPVEKSDWASPIVVARKPNGNLRICGDYSSTLNPALVDDPHPLPRIDDLLHEFNGARYFSKIDLRDAYHQLMLDEKSRKLTTISTPFGLFAYNRMSFGVKTAAATFQNNLETILHGIQGVVLYLDDITIFAETPEEHLARLSEVFARLRKHDLRVRMEKCAFLKFSVDFLGYSIDKDGIRPSASKLDGLREMPVPTNLKQLEAFIGYVNYYAKFVHQCAHLLAPLNELRKKDAQWEWTDTHQRAFEQIKGALLTSDVLAHYDPAKPLLFAADASDYGIGAVISHRDDDGTERIIANASRKLTEAERNYSQIEKEALAIIFGAERFAIYLLGRKFTLITDHQPLLRIFGPKKDLPVIAARRLNRWALRLSEFDYDIVYRKTDEFACADGLSRLPSPKAAPSYAIHSLSYDLDQVNDELVEESPLDWTVIAEATAKDRDLIKVYEYVSAGWPNRFDPELKSWWDRRHELTLASGCLLFREKPVIPERMIPEVLKAVHSVHVGENRMLAILRETCFFPRMSKAIHQVAIECPACNINRENKPHRGHPWQPASRFWERVHIDYAGPFLGSHWLIVVDSYSNWIEVLKARTPDTSTTTTLLKQLFTRYGFPEIFVSDNGPAFRSERFRSFCHNRDIIHILTPPYHPQSNGLAERAVRTFKVQVKKHLAAGHPLITAVQQMLLAHRISKKSPGEKSPAEKAFGRSLKTRLNISNRESLGTPKKPLFSEGQAVWFRAYSGDRWRQGRIVKVVSRVTFMVGEGEALHYRHVDQIRPASVVTHLPMSSAPKTQKPPPASKRPLPVTATPAPSSVKRPRIRAPTPEATPPSPPKAPPTPMDIDSPPAHPRIRAPSPEYPPKAPAPTPATSPTRPPRDPPNPHANDHAQNSAPSEYQGPMTRSRTATVKKPPSDLNNVNLRVTLFPDPPSTAREARTAYRRLSRHYARAIANKDPHAQEILQYLTELSARWEALKVKEG